MKQKNVVRLILALMVSASLAACGEKKEQGAVAAKVNDGTIAVSSLEFELKQLGDLPEAQKQKATEKVLKAMVDQQLLVQAAKADKLDANTEVQQRLQAAQNQILADAYVDKLSQSIAKPTETEIADYYNNNPALFSERAIYQLQELQIQSTPENVAEIKAKLAAERNLNEFARWLQSKSIPMQVRPVAKPAEQLAEAVLAKLKDLKPGEYFSVEQNAQLTLVILAKADKRPVTMEQARDAIERFIVNRKKRENMETALQSLRTKAKIEYIPPYTAPESNAANPAK